MKCSAKIVEISGKSFKHFLLISCSLALLNGASASSSYTDTYGNQVYLNDRGMPVSVQSADENSEVHFIWSHTNKYMRSVQATASSGMVRVYRPLPLGAVELAGVRFDERTLRALDQIRHGGEEYREEASAADFLLKHPIQVYTLQVNRQLTERFGMGFSAAVYKSLVAADPKNQAFAQEFQKRFVEVRSGRLRPIGQRLKNVSLMIANGYLQGNLLLTDPKSVTEVQGPNAILMRMFPNFGLFSINTAAALERNDYIIAAKIKQILDKGQDLICMGESKGGIELLGALSLLGQSGYFTSNLNNRGKILAVIMASGLTGGSILADWISEDPQYWLIYPFMRRLAERNHESVDAYRPGISGLTNESVKKYYAAHLDGLPKNLFYLNLIGIPGEYGLVESGSLRSIQELLMEGRYFPVHGANDGLVEFPNIGTDRALTPNSVQVPFDSSHDLMDGRLFGMDMTSQENQRHALETTFHLIADRYPEKFPLSETVNVPLAPANAKTVLAPQ